MPHTPTSPSVDSSTPQVTPIGAACRHCRVKKPSKSPVTELNTAGMTLFTVYCYCEQLGFNRGCLLTVDLASRLLLKRSPTVGHVEPVHRLPPGPRDPGQRGHGELGSPHRSGPVHQARDTPASVVTVSSAARIAVVL